MPLPRPFKLRKPKALSQRPASAFRDLVAELDTNEIGSALDVGAGGFVGATTTEHLLDLLEAPVTAIELDADRAEALSERFGDQLEVVVGDVWKWDEERAFDLVVLDIDTPRIPGIFEEHLEGRMLELVRPGGLVISVIVSDAEQAYHGPKALPAENEAPMVAFLERYFGTRKLTESGVKAQFARHPHYRALALVDKWRGDPANYVGWLALRRLPA
jgi:protein-L-isoaspartate O-methyltransferase